MNLHPETTLENVRNYYGKVLQSNQDLQTTACCTADAIPKHIKEIICQIHPEIIEKFYGCGSPIPERLEGCTVLDLGCGTGRDCYILSKLVGENGKVIGVDMTDEQLAVAKKHLDYHTQAFGYKKSNVEFKKGFIEDLASLDIADNSVDVVVSNCVINLSPDKHRVFAEIFRVLKPGGELYFSDVFSDRRIPKHLREDPMIHGECLGGAMYIEDFRRVLGELGCKDFRTINSRILDVENAEIEKRLENTCFSSQTIRAFKLELEDRCEDFGQVAYYNGGIENCPNYFDLDDHHCFEINRPLLVCGNTADMLSKTRFAKHFRIEGDKSNHFGLFDCAESCVDLGDGSNGGCGCC